MTPAGQESEVEVTCGRDEPGFWTDIQDMDQATETVTMTTGTTGSTRADVDVTTLQSGDSDNDSDSGSNIGDSKCTLNTGSIQYPR